MVVVSEMLFFVIFLCLLLTDSFGEDEKHKNVSRHHPEFKIFVANNDHNLSASNKYYPNHVSKDSIYTNAHIGESLSVTNGLWNSEWHWMDEWFLHQFTVSPLNVQSAKEADMVYIPTAFYYFEGNRTRLVKEMIDNALELFPTILQKPHVIVLNHPVHAYVASIFSTSPNYKLFWFVSLMGNTTPMSDLKNVVAPYFTRQHWHGGMARYHEKFNASQIAARKKYLATASWLDRDSKTGKGEFYHSRVTWKKACKDRKKVCKFIEWNRKLPKESAIKVQAHIDSSWYTLLSMGDFYTRVTTYDVFTSDAIAVMEPVIERHLPYTDRLNYSHFVVFKEATEKNVVDSLQKEFKLETALKMMETQFELKHIFQYSLYPSHHLIQVRSRNLVHANDDAFTFTVKSLIRRWCQDGSYKHLNC